MSIAPPSTAVAIVRPRFDFRDVRGLGCPAAASGRLQIFFLAIVLGLPFALRADPTHTVRSPDGEIRAEFQAAVPGSSDVPSWSLDYRGHRSLFQGTLGFELAGRPRWLEGARVVEVRRRSVNQRPALLHGKASHALDHFEETRLDLATRDGAALTVTLRCYDDAFAFRCEFNGLPASKEVVLQDEGTTFRISGDPVARVQELEHHRTSHEHEVRTLPASGLRPGTLLDLPLTLEWPDGTYAAITEAALRGYAGMALSRTSSVLDRIDLVCRLTPRADNAKVVRTAPFSTPWRVILLGRRPGALLESTTLYALNDPPAFDDTTWIRPGKITFHWWNGDVFDGRPGAPILSFDMARQYIDFCARHGLAAHSLTSTEGTTTPWYQQSKPGVEPGPDTDVTQPRPGFELERIRQYAESKGVRLWTWVHQAALRGRVDEAFAAFERLGWSGLMVDFFDHDDQDSVEHAEAILAAAARHHLLVHLHGVWKPTGLERTYPNLMNHEGALNLEYLKWSDRCTPDHSLNLAFTRLIAGPMDYHLGGFRAVPRSEFTPQNVAPVVLGTRAHMLALYVCFDNPMPMVADYPAAYEGQPGFDFLKDVPTWWDETRVVHGEPGSALVTARRRGAVWYVGGLSATQPRTLDVPLRFLGRGRFQADLWLDALFGPESSPNALAREQRRVSARDTLVLPVARDGGFVARFTPAGRLRTSSP